MEHKIIQLLENDYEPNVLLGLQFLEGLGVPEQCLKPLFFLGFFHNNEEVNSKAQQLLEGCSLVDFSVIPKKNWNMLHVRERQHYDDIAHIFDWLEQLPAETGLISEDFLNRIFSDIGIRYHEGRLFLLCIQHNISPKRVTKLYQSTSMSFYIERYFRGDLCYEVPKRSIKTLPRQIGELTNLTELILVHHSLEELPEEIGQLTKLTYLNICNNSLKQLPKSFEKLTNLIILKADNNQFEVFPKEILHCTQLTRLELKGNKLESIPQEIKQLANLQRLNISYNLIGKLPGAISCLPNLTDLRIGYNKIKTLPQSINKLRQLQCLDAAANRLKNLPKGFEQLDSLRELLLRNNLIAQWSVPAYQLYNLRVLDLRENKLEHLRFSNISTLTGLKLLRVEDNPLPREEVTCFKAHFPHIQIFPMVSKSEWRKYPRLI